MNNFIEKTFANIKELKVLVVGDVILDAYTYGDVHRISPEAPVPVIQFQKNTYTLGGAANVARNVASLGAKVCVCGVVGADEGCVKLRECLANHDILLPEVFSSSKAKTIEKTRIVIRKQQFCRIDKEDAPEFYELSDEMCQELFAQAEKADLIIVSDYAKGNITEALVARLIEIAKSKNILISIDPKPSRKLDFKGVDLMTPNKSEAYMLAGIKESIHENKNFPAEEICKIINEKYAPENLVITLGADGMLLSKNGKILKTMPTKAKEVFDVSGAGDTVIAMLSLALAAKCDLESSAELGNIAAGIVVGKFGTDITTPSEILAYTL